MKWNEFSLKEFEGKLATDFGKGLINCPLHLCGGNEKQLLNIFENVKPEDWIVSTHRNHYHYLLKGGDEQRLIAEIYNKDGRMRSMNFTDTNYNFISTAIVAGGCAISVGIALANKKRGLTSHTYCFVGDGAEDSGHFIEAVRFGFSRSLPLTFIIEDNDACVDSTKADRWINYQPINSPNIIRYNYKRIYPHVGIGKHVSF